MLPLDPPLAILVGLLAGFLVFYAAARSCAGVVWPRGRVPFYAYWRWLMSLAMGWLTFYYTTVLLMPSRADVEPCKTVWEQTPDPAGAWFYAFVGVALLLLGLIYLVYLKTSDRVDWAACASPDTSGRGSAP